MSQFLQDAAYACRTLRRAPGLAVTAILSLGLGIAATTAVFSFVNALQFKDLPFLEPAALVDIEETSTTELCAGCAVGTSYPTLLDWQARARSFAGIGGYEETRRVISAVAGSGAAHPPERVPSGLVTAGLFPLLGLQPALGRGFTAEDDRPGAAPVTLLSEMLWRRRFDASPDVLGTALKVDGVAHVIVGVMPPDFRFPEFAQFWTPLAQARHDQTRGERTLGAIARLRPGVGIAAAAAEMQSIGASLAAEHQVASGQWSTRVRSLHDDMTEETIAPAAVLLGAVGFVLLIACANVSNLLLVRAIERQREISIRIAIGSTRSRIVRLVLAESLTLGAAGGLLGLALAVWANRVIVASFGIDPPYWIRFGIDWRVFVFCAAITLGTALLFGLAPALQASRHEPQAVLKQGGAATAGRGSRRLAGGLVMSQLALALLLLAGAGLLIKTVVRSARFDPGFDAARVLEGDVSLPVLRYPTPASIDAFVDDLMAQLSRIPSIRAGVQSHVFFRGFGAEGRRVTVEGLASVPDGASPGFYSAITPGHFRMLGVAMKQGREFGASDRDDVVIVNEEMAQRIWPGQPVLGRRVKFGEKPWRTVVGVIGSSDGGLGAGRRPFAYVPFASEPGRDLAVMIATDGDPSARAGDLRAAVRAVDPDQPVEDVMTLEAAFHAQAAPARFVALLMTGLSFVALALAAVGLYGVTSYAVRRRLREIGIRVALGGTAADVVRLIMGSAWRVIAPGLLLGVGAAFAGTRALQGILFGTSPTDPAVFAGTVLTLAVIASLASYLPARRAARVDPISVLRNE